MKNSLLLKIITTISALFFLSCCLQKKNTVNSNENLGFSENGNNEYTDNGIYDSKSVNAGNPVKIGQSIFVEGSNDVPLAKNLTKFSDDNVDFDFASGNIASIIYKNNSNNNNDVKAFYLKTLPELGWKIVKNKKKNSNLMKFLRDNEKLEVEFFNKDKEDFVKFLLVTPR